jgi:hypothetical protein
MILTTITDEVWIVESEEVADDLIGSKVIVEGVVAGSPTRRLDWRGQSSFLILLRRISRDELENFPTP